MDQQLPGVPGCWEQRQMCCEASPQAPGFLSAHARRQADKAMKQQSSSPPPYLLGGVLLHQPLLFLLPLPRLVLGVRQRALRLRHLAGVGAAMAGEDSLAPKTRRAVPS